MEETLTDTDWTSIESRIPSAPGTKSALLSLHILRADTTSAGVVEFDDAVLIPESMMEPAILVTPEQFAELKLGMTFDQIINTLGTPFEVRESSSFVSYRYDPQAEDPQGRTFHYYIFLRFDEHQRLKEKKLVAR